MGPSRFCTNSWARRVRERRAALVGLSVLLSVTLLLLLAGCKSGGPLEPYKPTGADVTVTSPAGAKLVLKGEEADLYREIEYIREALNSGRVKWDSEALMKLASDSQLASGGALEDASLEDVTLFFDMWLLDPARDPASVLDDTEAFLFAPANVNLFVVRDATREQAEALLTELQGRADVESVTLVGKEEALVEMREKLKDNPELFQDLPQNPFPDKLRVFLKSGASLDEFIAQYSKRPEVDEVLAEERSGAARAFAQMPFEVLRALVYMPYYYEKVYE